MDCYIVNEIIKQNDEFSNWVKFENILLNLIVIFEIGGGIKYDT